MKHVYVITGGGSGMGLATIRKLDKGHIIVISGRTMSKLEQAVESLKADGYEIIARECDVSKRNEVKDLAAYCASLGKIDAVIHAAGVSPHMGDAKTIISINALGTHYVDQEFKEVMDDGVILNVSSMSAYMLPKSMLPIKHYMLVFKNETRFLKKLTKKARMFGKKMETSIGYPISKNFVCWYTKRVANEMYQKGIRVISVSPGNFETPMGKLESAQGSAFLKNAAIHRFGDPEEIASLFAMLIDPKLGYLTGTDIVMDGGTVGNLEVYSRKEQKRFK